MVRLLFQCVIAVLLCDNTYTQKERTQKVTIKKLAVTSRTSTRYAMVDVFSVVENEHTEDSEVHYEVRLPKSAFITGFRMLVNEKNITASIMQKEEAKEVYDSAKESQITAGMVTQRSIVSDGFDVDIFGIAVNVAGKSRVEFNLQYEELLLKKGGKYRQKIYIDSDHAIPELEIICEFREAQRFKGLTYITPFDEEKLLLDEENLSVDGYYTRKVEWRPSETEQESATIGLDRPFEVEYELDPPSDGGVVFYNDEGKFVHLFSTICEETKIMMKQIVFVIDISGSMNGNPIEQVRQSMYQILSQLRRYDYFNIILFESKTRKWRPNFEPATEANIAIARQFIAYGVKANGGTNINDALIEATQQFDDWQRYTDEDSGRYGQVIVFLTDGSATAGVTSPSLILANLKRYNFVENKCCKSTIHTIAFGSHSSRNFLRQVAHEHGGTMTIIKDTNDNVIDDELVQTYGEMSNPYYGDLQFSFKIGNRDDKEELPDKNVTQNRFVQYDCGCELVICGWTRPGMAIFPTVKVHGAMETIVFDAVQTLVTEDIDSNVISRLVAYKTVQSLLMGFETETDDNKLAAKELALNISLEYGFVTPLTSLVVTEYVRKKFQSVDFKNKALVTTRSHRSNSFPVSFNDSEYDEEIPSFFEQTTVNHADIPSVTRASVLYSIVGVFTYMKFLAC